MNLNSIADPRHARIVWSQCVEPGDEVAGALVRHLGPLEALRAVLSSIDSKSALSVADVDMDVLTRRIARWESRLSSIELSSILRSADSMHIHVLCPEDEYWPRGLDALHDSAPMCLWVRTLQGAHVLRSLNRSMSIVGARASTGYGDRVASLMGSDAVSAGFTVVSGGAYGIDAAAHRGALSVDEGGCTIAVMAGGADRLYPKGNEDLLRTIIEVGAVVSEAPLGAAPLRSHFLQRNRLIAALTSATIVVEAGRRSGALNTATWARRLLKPLGVVPGPVTSAVSAGCHHLLREGEAVCVCDGQQAIELAGCIGDDLSEDDSPQDTAIDRLSGTSGRVLDVVPRRGCRDLDAIICAAGVTPHEAIASLGSLEIAGFVTRNGMGWRKTVRC